MYCIFCFLKEFNFNLLCCVNWERYEIISPPNYGLNSRMNLAIYSHSERNYSEFRSGNSNEKLEVMAIHRKYKTEICGAPSSPVLKREGIKKMFFISFLLKEFTSSLYWYCQTKFVFLPLCTTLKLTWLAYTKTQ